MHLKEAPSTECNLWCYLRRKINEAFAGHLWKAVFDLMLEWLSALEDLLLKEHHRPYVLLQYLQDSSFGLSAPLQTLYPKFSPTDCIWIHNTISCIYSRHIDIICCTGTKCIIFQKLDLPDIFCRLQALYALCHYQHFSLEWWRE